MQHLDARQHDNVALGGGNADIPAGHRRLRLVLAGQRQNAHIRHVQRRLERNRVAIVNHDDFEVEAVVVLIEERERLVGGFLARPIGQKERDQAASLMLETLICGSGMMMSP